MKGIRKLISELCFGSATSCLGNDRSVRGGNAVRNFEGNMGPACKASLSRIEKEL